MLNNKDQSKLTELISKQENGELDNCIIYDLSDAVYHHPDCPGFSNSQLSYMKRSYSHLHRSMDERLESILAPKAKASGLNVSGKGALKMDVLSFGQMIHCMLLKPSDFKKDYVLFEEASEDQKLDPNMTVINHDDFKQAIDISNAVKRHETLGPLLELETTKTEVTFFSRCPVSNILRRCKVDLINQDLSSDQPYAFIADLKTTQDASYGGFQRSIVNYDYDRQAAYYTDIVSSCLKLPVSFVFAAVEKQAPYGVQLFSSEHLIEVGREMYLGLLKRLSDFQNSKAPYGYGSQITEMHLPPYAFDIDKRLGN